MVGGKWDLKTGYKFRCLVTYCPNMTFWWLRTCKQHGLMLNTSSTLNAGIKLADVVRNFRLV